MERAGIHTLYASPRRGRLGRSSGHRQLLCECGTENAVVIRGNGAGHYRGRFGLHAASGPAALLAQNDAQAAYALTAGALTPPSAPTVSTFVGSGLDDPAGLAFDAAGNLYVANYGNNTISKVTPAGAVSTFVSSGLNDPAGLAFDAAGNLYVANYGNNTISKVTPAGAVSTFVSSGLD